MERNRRRKKQKQSKKEIGVKACIREHNRLMKMNDCYNAIRECLYLSPSISKAKTLVEAIQYINMLKYVLDASPEGTGGDDDANGAQAIEPHSDKLEMGEELEEKYTLKDDFRAILPKENRDMPISKLAKKMPYFMKLLSLTTMPTSDDSDSGRGSVPECCFTPPCKPMLLEVENEQAAVKEEVTQQTPIDTTDETDDQQETFFTENSFKFLIKNLLTLSADDSDESTKEHELNCPLISDEAHDIQNTLPTTTEVLEQAQVPLTENPYATAQEPEQLNIDQTFLDALETNLGEASFEWLDNNLPECDEFFNEHNELHLNDLHDLSLEEMLSYLDHQC